MLVGLGGGGIEQFDERLLQGDRRGGPPMLPSTGLEKGIFEGPNPNMSLRKTQTLQKKKKTNDINIPV